ncbi:MAG: GGDEF domain-containing protein [Gammaproteobacteria bacterium]|nr:GGDEF domain-containing protein [Gammaproteobacteria bacterium]
MRDDRALHDILEHSQLTPLFQPICSLVENRIYGYEALIRGPAESPLHTPTVLFADATKYARLAEADQRCSQVCIEAWLRLQLQGKLFLNINPASLMQPGFRGSEALHMMGLTGVVPDQVVLEITEHTPTGDYALLREAVVLYRSMGFEIAIDDMGTGYSSLRLWSELRPDYVKIDMHFTQGMYQDRSKRQFVQSIMEIASDLNCKVIAEGVETREDHQALYDVGVTMAQGYYFAPPDALPSIALDTPSLAPEPPAHSGYVPGLARSAVAATLISPRPTLDPDTPVEVAGELFHGTPNLNALPVVRGDIPLGLVRRTQLMNVLASRYGRDLHGKKPVSYFMERRPLIVDKSLPLEKLSKLVTSEDDVYLSDEFIITSRGRYLGMSTIVQLLKKITDLQVRNARYSNPLTLLPGSVPINERLDSLLKRRWGFVMCYCDLDNFKPFNDACGYSQGDEAIKLLARILVDAAHSRHDFVGHVGGDDFVIIFLSQNWQQRCQAIIDSFAVKVVELYAEEERTAGGVWSKDRRGNKVFFPVMTLSLAAVEAPQGRFVSHHEIAARVSEIKTQAKNIAGNSLFVDRRRTDGDAGQLSLID